MNTYAVPEMNPYQRGNIEPAQGWHGQSWIAPNHSENVL